LLFHQGPLECQFEHFALQLLRALVTSSPWRSAVDFARFSAGITGNTLDSERYRREIQAAYVGEVWGAAFFEALSQQTSLASIRDGLLTLARLETETRARLRPLAERLGLDTTIDPKDVAQGKARAEQWAGIDRREFARRLSELVSDYVVRYDSLVEEAAPADTEILTFLAAHERALLVFSERELAGETQTALGPVLALLAGIPEPAVIG
jgi:hypothetical protein